MLRSASSLSALALVGGSFALAACGSSSSSDASSPSKPTTTAPAPGQGGGDQQAQLQKFEQCLKDQGVSLPQRPGGHGQGNDDGRRPRGRFGYGGGLRLGGGASSTTPGGGARFQADPKLQKALQACAKDRPQFRGGPGGQRPLKVHRPDIKAFTPYLSCLKDKGLDVKVSDGFNALRNLKPDDPKVQSALRSCRSKLPQRPAGPPDGTPPSGGPASSDGGSA